MATKYNSDQDRHWVESRVKRTSELIRFARMNAGLTQAALAERICSSQQQIARYETGKQAPTIESLYRIANALNIDASVLLSYKSFPFSSQRVFYVSVLGEDIDKTIYQSLEEANAAAQAVWNKNGGGLYQVSVNSLPANAAVFIDGRFNYDYSRRAHGGFDSLYCKHADRVCPGDGKYIITGMIDQSTEGKTSYIEYLNGIGYDTVEEANQIALNSWLSKDRYSNLDRYKVVKAPANVDMGKNWQIGIIEKIETYYVSTGFDSDDYIFAGLVSSNVSSYKYVIDLDTVSIIDGHPDLLRNANNKVWRQWCNDGKKQNKLTSNYTYQTILINKDLLLNDPEADDLIEGKTYYSVPECFNSSNC